MRPSLSRLFDRGIGVRDRPPVLFVGLSIIFLWLPWKENLFVWGLSLWLMVRGLFARSSEHGRVRAFEYLILFYGLWVGLAIAIHYFALSSLGPRTFITVARHDAQWGVTTLLQIGRLYLLFPLLFCAAITLLRSDETRGTLHWLPILAAPSLLVALYQGLVDVHFLNQPFFARLHRVSGLATDANAFGLSLFLLFPLSVFGILRARERWKRLLLVSLTLAIIVCLGLSGSRTASLGAAALLVMQLAAWAWLNPGRGRARAGLSIASTAFLLVVVASAIVSLKGDAPFVVFRRMHSTLLDVRDTGMKSMFNKSWRGHYGLYALRLTAASPVSGWGPGGFYRNLDNVRYRDGVELPAVDNANNHYLQQSSELGLLGLSLNVSLHLVPLWMIFRVRKRIREPLEKLLVVSVFLTLSIFLLLYLTGPHTIAPDVLWIAVMLLAYLFVTALKHGYARGRPYATVTLVILSALTVVFLGATWYNALGPDGYRGRQAADWWPFKYDRNCYPAEKWRDGDVRWCGKDAFLQIPVTGVLPSSVSLKFLVLHPDLESNPVRVRYGPKSGPLHEVVVIAREWMTIGVPVTDDYVEETFSWPEDRLKRALVLSLDVSRTWVPRKWRVSQDPRELGIALVIPHL